MKKGMLFLIIAIFLVAGGFSGCAKKVVKTEMEAEYPALEPEEITIEEEVEAPGIFEEEVVEEVALIPLEEPLTRPGLEGGGEAEAAVSTAKLKDVFFDYDRYAIRDDAREILYANARFLKKNKNAGIIIEGHCDERGTIEYNIALGERRATAVKKFLTDLGIDPRRISIISYGKERPFCLEHTEQCWQDNRRGHMVLKR